MATKISKIISTVFHPFLVIPLTLVLVVIRNGYQWTQIAGWLGITIGFTLIPILIVIGIGKRAGKYADWDVSHQARRGQVYPVGVVSVAVATGLAFLFQAPRLIQAVQLAGLLVLVSAWIINCYTKVSIHTIIISGSACLLILWGQLSGLATVLVLAIMILVGITRKLIKAHSISQVFLGGFLGIVTNLVSYWLLK